MPATIVTTAASVTKLIDSPPNILAEAVLGAVLGNTSISDSIITEFNYGFNSKVNSYYRYGANHFTRGLPTGTFIQGTDDELEALLLAAINVDIHVGNPFAFNATSVLSSGMALPDIRYMAHMFFQDSPEWDLQPSTQSPGYGGDPGGNFVWGTSVTNVVTGIVYWVPHIATFNNQVLHMEMRTTDYEDTYVLDVPFNFNKSTTVYNVIYGKGTNILGAIEYYFWVYDPASHRHPSLDFAASTTNAADFYPIAPIRIENNNIVDVADNAELATSTSKLLRKIGIDLDKFSADIQDPDDTTALDDVDNGYLMFAMTLNSAEDISLRYLYEYFRSLYYSNPILSQQNWIDNPNSDAEFALRPSTRNHLFIKDIGIDILIMFNFITIEVKNGLIGDPHGAYNPNTVVGTGAEIDAASSGIGAVNKEVITGTETEGNPGRYYNDHVVIYRKQLTSTVNGDASNTFVELVVHGLQHNMLVDARAGKIHRTAISTDDGFFIPVARGVVMRFNGADESLIYYESLVFLAYAIDELKLSWYQDPAFLSLVSFVVLIISVIFAAPDIGAAIEQGIVGMLNGLAYAYVAGIIVSEAFSLVIDMVGGDFALILAALATAVAIYYGDTSTQLLEFITPDQLLGLSTQMIDAVNQNTAETLVQLEQDIELLEEQNEAWQEELDAAEDLLHYGTNIDLLAITSKQTTANSGETPEQFFNRTIHLSNPGVLALDMVSSYVDRALTLPDFTQRGMS